MRALLRGALVVLVPAAGCGDSAVCDALVQGTHAADARGAPCGIHYPLLFHGDCPDWLRGCTDSDRAKVQAYGTCLSNLPVCSPETLQTWNDELAACASVFAGLSPSCPSTTIVRKWDLRSRGWPLARAFPAR